MDGPLYCRTVFANDHEPNDAEMISHRLIIIDEGHPAGQDAWIGLDIKCRCFQAERTHGTFRAIEESKWPHEPDRIKQDDPEDEFVEGKTYLIAFIQTKECDRGSPADALVLEQTRVKQEVCYRRLGLLLYYDNPQTSIRESLSRVEKPLITLV